MFAVGYGANHFVPLLAVYRRELGLSDAAATAVFAVYAVGLVPGLLVGGPVSDRFGRRRIVLAFAALSLVASAVLVTGAVGEAGLYVGRLLTGVVSGTVFTVGTAWVEELSAAAPGPAGAVPGLAARRAALALTAGFGVGPLVAGVLAQWAPAPAVLPYLVHLALGGVALALLPGAPETRPPAGAGARLRLLPAAARGRRFRRVVVPMGPFVFGSLSLAFTTLPAHGTRLPAGAAVVLTGVLAGVALAAGLAGQRWGRRLIAGRPGTAEVRPAVTGLAVVAAGYLVTALATARPGPGTGTAAAVVLGVGYGICLVVGLREVGRLAAPEELGGLVAVFYCLAYSGLAVPYALALVAPHLGYPPSLVVVAALAAACALAVAASARPR
jgi:MFS family permease